MKIVLICIILCCIPFASLAQFFLLGSTITGANGTEASPYSILSVVSDINNTNAIELVGNTFIQKYRMDLTSGHVILPTGYDAHLLKLGLGCLNPIETVFKWISYCYNLIWQNCI